VRIIEIAADHNSAVFYWASLRVQSHEIEASEAGVLNALPGLSQPPTGLMVKLKAWVAQDATV
jgi:hypothetical protein